MDIKGLLPKTHQANQYLCVMTDRYSKFTRAIPMSKLSCTHLANIFSDHWIIPLGIPSNFLTDDEPQAVNKFVTLVCGYLGVKHLTKTTYHSQTNSQAKPFSQSIVTRLQHYVVEHELDWDMYVQPLSYAYQKQFYRLTNTSPCYLML